MLKVERKLPWGKRRMKKNSTFKRFLAFLLCAAMMITYMPSSVYTLAYEGAPAAQQEVTDAAETPEETPPQEGDVVDQTESEPAEEAAPAEEETTDESVVDDTAEVSLW